MRLGGPPGVIDRLAAAPLELLQVIGDGVRDGVGAGPRVVAFLAPELGSPPSPRGFLGLPIAKNGYPVSVLQIVRGAEPVLGVATTAWSADGRARYHPWPAAGIRARSPFRDRASRAQGGSEAAGGRCGFRDSRHGRCVPFFAPTFWGVFGEYL